MLSIRSWNRWVCTTQPCVDGRRRRAGRPGRPRAASRSRTRRPLPILAPSDRSQTLSTGVPVAARANHGAATTSTKVSASSLRQTNELHSGWSDARRRPTSSHLASVVDARRDGAGRPSAPRPRPAAAAHQPARSASSSSSAPRRRARCRGRRITGTSRQQPRRAPGPPAAASAGCRSGCRRRPPAARRSLVGGLPSHEVPALALRTARGGRQHGDQALLGHLATRGRHAGVADEGVLADLHPLDAQPAAAELVAAEQGVVGEERTVADRGQASGSAAPWRPRRPCRPWPRARGARPASASSSTAGRARCAPRRGPAASTTPATPAGRAPGGDPRRAPTRAAGRSSHDQHGQRPRSRPRHRRAAARRARSRRRRRASAAPRHEPARRRQQAGQRRRGPAGGRSAPAIAAYASDPGGRFGGPLAGPRARGRRPTALRRGPRPGLPGRDLAEDRRARGDLGAAPDVRARAQHAAGRRSARPAPTSTRPTCSDVAVEPVTPQVDLGLDRAPVPQGEHPGHGRDRVQVDVPADRGAERPGVVRASTAAPARLAAPISSASRSASHRRRCTFPPRG